MDIHSKISATQIFYFKLLPQPDYELPIVLNVHKLGEGGGLHDSDLF